MTEIRKLPPQPRVDTGPIRFGDDWPGVFIRGDEAFYYADILRFLEKHVSYTRSGLDDGDPPIEEHGSPTLRELADLLESCGVNNT